MAKKPKLDQVARKRAAYEMPAPNDDIYAYGWDLKNIRYPDPKSADKKDPDPGKHIFDAPQETPRTMQRYGHDAQFICPKYLQMMLDTSPAIRDACTVAAEARYSAASIAGILEAINKEFADNILPDIAKNFEAVAPIIAQFYAARLAHIKKFGGEQEY
jgi:hypothetical protein